MSTERYNNPDAYTGIRYWPINEEVARRAKNANSFSEYVPGRATAEYRRCAAKAAELAQRQKMCVARSMALEVCMQFEAPDYPSEGTIELDIVPSQTLQQLGDCGIIIGHL